MGRALATVLAALLLAAISCAPPAAAAPEPPGRRVVIDGAGSAPVTLYYEEHGQGTPVLLLHGLGESSFTWHQIVPGLAARHRVIVLDLKGFGRSEKPADEAYAADDQAALVARFIEILDLKGVALVGHSFGGTVALRTALVQSMNGSGRIRRIAAIAAPALPRATARRLDLVMTPFVPDTLAAVIPTDRAVRFLLAESMGGKDPDDTMIEGYVAPYREPGAMHAFFTTARAIIGEKNAKAVGRRYKALRQPVLLVWCRKDPIVPLRAGRDLAAVVPKARLAILERCHHLPQHERPEALLRTLTPFLAK